MVQDAQLNDPPLPLWEVFLNEEKETHMHAGSLHASDPEMALQNARDLYTRRGFRGQIWVVETKCIAATTPDSHPALETDRIHQHPQLDKAQTEEPEQSEEERSWEIFIQPETGLPHQHAGQLRADNAKSALQNAPAQFGLKSVPASLWAVPSKHIVAGEFDPPAYRKYLFTTDYKVPRALRSDEERRNR